MVKSSRLGWTNRSDGNSMRTETANQRDCVHAVKEASASGWYSRIFIFDSSKRVLDRSSM